jgi:hypothetical protein
VNSLESGQHNLVGSYGPPQDFDKNWNYSFELPVLGARGTLHWQDPDFYSLHSAQPFITCEV